MAEWYGSKGGDRQFLVSVQVPKTCASRTTETRTGSFVIRFRHTSLGSESGSVDPFPLGCSTRNVSIDRGRGIGRLTGRRVVLRSAPLRRPASIDRLYYYSDHSTTRSLSLQRSR